MKVYKLVGSYIGNDVDVNEMKEIGYFQSEEKAKVMWEHMKAQPSFHECFDDVLLIYEIEVL